METVLELFDSQADEDSPGTVRALVHRAKGLCLEGLSISYR